MKKVVLLLLMVTSISQGQEIQREIERLQNLISEGDWASAAALSRSLKEEIAEARNQAIAGRGARQVDSILAWMPPNTETLLVAQQPFTIAGEKTAVPYIVGLLGVAEKGELLKQFENRTIILAAIGARKFGEGGPTDNVPRLGMIPYEGCAVYQLSDALNDVLLPRSPEEKLDGLSVWQSKGSEGDGPDWETFYTAMLDPQLLMVCNNHEFLREMVARKGAPQQPRALPVNLPEWSLVDRNSPAWGISHYRDGGMARLALQVPDATGIVVNFGKTAITARMISKTDPWQPFTGVPEFQGWIKTRKMTDDVWEFTVSPQGPASATATFALMGALGFVVVI